MPGIPLVVKSGKMNRVEYRLLHYWVEKQLGKPSICWDCGDTSERRYAWANKSGKYSYDTSDWERLCYPCHRRKDMIEPFPEYCKYGHKLVISNLYIKRGRSGGLHLECRQCRKDYRQKYLSKRLEIS